MRKTLDHKGKLFAKYPTDPFVRGNFYKYRKSYSKLCKFKRQKYKSDLVDKLDNLFENDPKAYCPLLDELRDNKRDSFESMTSPDEMFDHFSSLNILPNKFHQRAKEIEELLVNTENSPSFSKLVFLMTQDEVSKCLHALSAS